MSKESALEQLQSHLTRKYMGRAGIHGIGLRRSKSAITLYVDPQSGDEQKELLDLIKKEIEPYSLIVVEERPASIDDN